MAGEDPGVGTLSVVLELIQRAGSAVTGTIKNTIGFGLDVIRTGVFFSWRRQMMQAAQLAAGVLEVEVRVLFDNGNKHVGHHMLAVDHDGEEYGNAKRNESAEAIEDEGVLAL